jgi:3'-phosphoadenosine 5'-phosphosulfate sulfotransferase (PAPS reductase)/FAD synthetase
MDESKVEKSLEIVREAAYRANEAGTPLFINFSGGKDSSSLLLLARQVSDKVEAIYMSSGIELPGSIEFVQRECERLSLPLHITYPDRDYMGNFNYWVHRFGYFPSYKYNYCSSRLKLRPLRAYLRKKFGFAATYKLNGVRQSESTRRRKIYKDRPYITPDWEMSGSFIVQPIQDWNSLDVKEFLEKNNFTVQKQYSSFGVSGCAYCPFYQEDIYYRILSVYPNIYDEIIDLENEIGKPSVGGNVFLHELRDRFLKDPEGIIAGLPPLKQIKRDSIV